MQNLKIRKENKTMKKILAFVMTLALLCGMMASCHEDALSLIENANATLQEQPYEMTMSIVFSCDDPTINSVFSAMNMEIPVTVDGKNIAMDMSMNISGYSANINVIIADMVMYYDMNLMGQSVKVKANINDNQYKELMEESGTDIMLDPKDFGELTVESKNGKKFIACGQITEEGLDKLNDIIDSSLDSINGEASVSEVTYGLTLNGGKYEAMNLSCVYSVTAYGETYNVTLELGAEFSYDDVSEVKAPADANTYQSMSYDDIMG